jgi:Fur family transcriptional regulator, ferric uptake regulator
MDIARRILKEHDLSITTSRLAVLEIFLQTPYVLDHTELMALCKKKVNRITLYRTLHLFYQQHLLVKVPSSNGITRYLYRGPGIREDVRREKAASAPQRKIHLICQDCGRIISVENAKLPPIDLPRNFEASFVDLIVNGRCKEC